MRYARQYLADIVLLLITAQAAFVLIGVAYLGFAITWIDIAVTLAAVIATELACANIRAYARGEPAVVFFPKAAVAAGLGILLFMRAVDPSYFALAACIAIASKYVIRLGGKHVFNPSNLGILAVVIAFTSSTTIEFTQWGGNPFVFAGISLVAFGVAYRSGVIVTTLSFLASYAALLVIAVTFAPGIFLTHHYGLIGPSLAIFASFMITDPRTSPTGFLERILHGMSVACLYFFLESIGVRYSLFVASFGMTALTVLSTFATRYLKALQPRFAAMPRNAASFLFASAVLMPIAATEVAAHRFSVNPFRLSPSFLLFGVEAQEVRACIDPISRIRP